MRSTLIATISDSSLEEASERTVEAQPILSDDYWRLQFEEDITVDGGDFSCSSAETLPSKWIELPFALAFSLQVVGVLATAILYGIPLLFASTSTAGGIDKENFVAGFDRTTALTFMAALLVVGAICSFAMLRRLVLATQGTATFVKGGSYFVHFSYCLASVALISTGFQLISNWIIALLMMTLGATFVVSSRKQQSKLPFAISTLNVAGCAILTTPHLTLLAAKFLLFSCIWMMMWCLALTGVSKTTFNENWWCLAALGFSLLWTLAVLRNLLRVATAVVVGSWWLSVNSETRGRQSWHVRCTDDRDLLFRSCFYRFGSICFGSLASLAAPLVRVVTQFLFPWLGEEYSSRALCSPFTSKGTAGSPCICDRFRFVSSFCSRYSMVLLAFGNTSFVDASGQAQDLFQCTSWIPFSQDRFAFQVLAMYRGVVVATTGTVALLAYVFIFGTRDGTSSSDPTLIVVFAIGCVLGFLTSSLMMAILESAVETVIVCLAAFPDELAHTHKTQLELLQVGWSTGFPQAWHEQTAFSHRDATPPPPRKV